MCSDKQEIVFLELINHSIMTSGLVLNSPDSSDMDSSGPLELRVESDSSRFKTGVLNPALEDRSPAGISVPLSPEIPLSLERTFSVW